jgi:plastocyanin
MNTPCLVSERMNAQHNGRAPRGPRAFWLIAACGFAIIVSATFLVPSRSASAAPANSAVVQISMRDVKFSPVTVQVTKGGVVEWKNDDLIPHTATSPLFDSGSLASGQTWRHSFKKAGRFPYACTFHPHMNGVVIVK